MRRLRDSYLFYYPFLPLTFSSCLVNNNGLHSTLRNAFVWIIYLQHFNFTVFLFIKVFSVISSCVRVDIDGVKSVYNSGQVFMIPSGE